MLRSTLFPVPAWHPRRLLAAAALVLLAAPSIEARPRQAPRPPQAPAAAYGYSELHPAWLQGGYWIGRPWPSGWYRNTPAAWAQDGMAAGGTITRAVNSALADQVPIIAVPNTPYQLNFASVEALPNSRILFFYSNGSTTQRGVGECQLGLLDGRPASGLGALVLNAACIVAYGRGA